MKRALGAFFAMALLVAGCSGSGGGSLVTFSPADGALNQSLDVEVFVRFLGEVQDPESWEAAFTLKKDDTGETVCTEVIYDLATLTAICAHEDLEPLSSYTATVEVRSIVGYTISGHATFATGTGISAPSHLAAADAGTGLTVSWDDAAGAASYNLYWGLSSGVTKETGTKIEGVTSPYEDFPLVNEVPVYYIATAVDESGNESDASAEATGTPTFHGEIDASFATGGTVTEAMEVVQIQAAGLNVDADGNTFAGLGSSLWKFDATGSLVPTFGTGGLATITACPEGEFAVVDSIAVASGGNLFIYGFCTDGGDTYIAYIWGCNGVSGACTALTDGGIADDDNTSGGSIVLASDGGLVVNGRTEANVPKIWKYSAVGAPVWDVDIDLEGHAAGATGAVVTDAQGAFYVSGAVVDAGEEERVYSRIWKFESNGAPGTDFGDGGVFKLESQPGYEDYDEYIFNGIARVGATGEIVAAGGFPDVLDDSSHTLVVKVDALGQGVEGSFMSSETTGSSAASVVLVEKGERILTTGYALGTINVFETFFFEVFGVNASATALDATLFDSGIYALSPITFGLNIAMDVYGRAIVLSSAVTADFTSGSMSVTRFR